jgi:hypothetical protein
MFVLQWLAMPNPDDDAATRLENRETVRLPIQRRPVSRAAPPRARKAPLALAAGVTTLWAAVVSFVPMLVIVGLVYALDQSGVGAGRIVRFGLSAWLLAHGVPIHTGLGAVSLVPLALSVVAAWRVARAGVHTARAIGARRGTSPWPAVAAGGTVGVAYGVVGGIAAAVAGESVVRSILTLAVFGFVAGSAGAMIEARTLARLAGRTPPALRDGIRTGVVAALFILGAGAALAGVAVAVKGGDAASIIHDYRAGVAGQLGLLLACGLYAPNLVTWSASYLVGPGFVIGNGTSISVAAVTVGPLPALPVLAGLPDGPAAGWGSLLLGVPLAAALAAGALLGRRAGKASWAVLLGASAVSGPVAGLLLGLASLASSGSLGGDRLATIGPHTVWTAVITAVVVAVGVVLAAALTRILAGVRRSRA